MRTNKEKGNDLEDAVHAIESYIFETQQGLKEATILFQRNKIVTIKGARSEIDLFAKVEFGKEYDSIFIFECKNCSEKVDKNEIIVFSEKINELNATKGFFIAKNFTKDAINRAKEEKRMVIVKVSTEITIDVFPVHYYSTKVEYTEVILKGKIQARKYLPEEIFELDGNLLTLDKLIESLYNEIQQEINHTEPEITLKEHVFFKKKSFQFANGRLLFQDTPIESIIAEFKFTSSRSTPVVKSQFDIEKRGRYCTIEFIDPNNGSIINASFSQLI